MIRSLTLIILALAFVGCAGGPEGIYKLDKEAVKKAAEAELATKSKEEQDFGALALAIIDQMDVTLDVKSGGKYEMKSSIPNPFKAGEKKEESETGDWKVEGDAIVFKVRRI